MQLALRTKRRYIDEIISGAKTSEFRACNDFYATRLGVLDDDGYVIAPKPYKTIKLYTGEKTDCKYVICDVKSIHIVEYEYEDAESDLVWEIKLGKVLEHN